MNMLPCRNGNLGNSSHVNVVIISETKEERHRKLFELSMNHVTTNKQTTPSYRDLHIQLLSTLSGRINVGRT